ncbi:MAG: DNA repair protein RecO [Bacteroidetes bacterium]|nr:DNA repair protein RecO [Bacteroidota bacterium]
MLQNTRGLVLRQTRYGETSLIVKLYTEAFGSQSYILSGARSAKSRTRAALFQPPNLLDLEVYYQEGRDLQRIREVRPLHVYARIPYSVAHSSIALFLTEVLGKCLRDEHAQEGLFPFLEERLLELDACEQGLNLFPLRFLLNLSQQLGFQPQGQFSEHTPWFDLQEGLFAAARPAHGYALFAEESQVLHYLLEHPHAQEAAPLVLPGALRQALMDNLLVYYRFHIEGFGLLRSPAILHEVLSRGH